MTTACTETSQFVCPHQELTAPVEIDETSVDVPEPLLVEPVEGQRE